jgi:transcription elongation GreA/GreB family factor
LWIIRLTGCPNVELRVGIGSKVTLRRVSDQAAVVMSFLGPWDSDVSRNVYSYQTPIAAELMGKPLGHTVTLKLDGQEAQYVIEAVAPALA